VTADKIYLVGFMAAGKTTLARELGRRLDWRVEDIDERIEAREGRTIASIFSRDGEPYFRAVERAVLVDLLPLRHVVVATGGGTFVDPDNRALINRDGFSVWLDASFDAVVGRLPADGRRPLAADREQFERLYAVRRTAYQQAHLRLDAGSTPSAALAEQVMAALSE
jgi:shikimate kinase